MNYEQLKAFVNNEIEPYLQNIEMWQCITTLGIKPFKDGNQWSFLYGDNIQDGICGFGDTIDRAAWDFYTNLKTEKEKQGEQKPTEKVEPKFKAGDIIRHKKQGFICKITAVDTEYRLSGGTHLPFDFQDAWELVEQKPAELAKGEDYGIDGLYAAVDILQKTLGNVEGYQTDDGILEHECAISAVTELSKQKPAWSEEDEARFESCIKVLQTSDGYDTINTKWLKSLKERYTWKPSEEQMHYLSWVANIKLGDSVVEQEVSKHLNELLEDLKKLRDK